MDQDPTDDDVDISEVRARLLRTRHESLTFLALTFLSISRELAAGLRKKSEVRHKRRAL